MLRQVLKGVGLLSMSAAFACAMAADMSDDAAASSTMDGVTVSTVSYQTPQLQLLRDDGKSVSLVKELDDGRPVVMNFIFTTCATTCPLSSQTFASFQNKLGAESARVHMVSISIDPEQDTPTRLRAYAKTFHAGKQWQHYTGTLQASQAAQQAFGAYRGDKMSHTPLTLLRAAPGKPWMRIEGFVTPDQLLHHYHDLLAAQ